MVGRAKAGSGWVWRGQAGLGKGSLEHARMADRSSILWRALTEARQGKARPGRAGCGKDSSEYARLGQVTVRLCDVHFGLAR